MMMPAPTATQNDSIFRIGKAMSRAPIMRGIRKFPNAPIGIGITTKNTMMVACMVNSAL